MRLSQYPLLFIVFISCFTTLLWLGERDFASRGEAREALAIQSVMDGNWIVPRGYGGVVASKPPLLHWISAAASSVRGGVNEFSARVPSGIASLIFVAFFFSFLRVRVGQRLAFLSGLLLLGSVDWFRTGIECRVDMLHSVLVAGALIAIFKWFECELKTVPSMLTLLLTGATLSKGPVGLVLPALVFFVYGAHKRLPVRTLLAKSLVFLIPAAALAGAWYLLAFLTGGEEFFGRFYYENIARMSGTMADAPHKHSVFYLFGALTVGTLPWILLLIPDFILWPLWPAVRHVYNSAISVKQSFRWLRVRLRLKRRLAVMWGRFYEWLCGRTSFEAFSIISVFVIFAFYSIPSGKRGVYLLPAYPFISFLAATYFLYMGLLHRRRAAITFKWFCRLIVGLYAVFLFLLIRNPQAPLNWWPGRNGERLQYLLDQVTLASSMSLPALITLALPLVIALWHSQMVHARRNQSYLTGMSALTFSMFLAFHAVLAPQFNSSLSPRAFANEVKPIVKEDALYSFGNEFYALSFYMHQQMTTVREGFREGMEMVLYERKLDELRSKLSGTGLQPRVQIRSSNAIVEPLEKVVLVRLVRV